MDKLLLRKRNGSLESHGKILIQPALPNYAGRKMPVYSNRKGFSRAH